MREATSIADVERAWKSSRRSYAGWAAAWTGIVALIFGGVSLTVPLEGWPRITSTPGGAAHVGLVACWIVGLLWMARSARELHRRLLEGHFAHRQFQESERRFHALAEQSPVGIFEIDAAGRFTRVNRAFADMLGYPTQELREKRLVDVLHPESQSDCQPFLRDADTARPEPVRLELACIAKDGRQVWGDFAAVFLPRDNGQPLWRLGMVQDTTARRLDEIRLREQAALLDIAQDAICVQSLSGQIEFWNPAAAKLYGWNREEVLGAPGNDLMFSRVSGELLQAQAEVLAKGSWSGELVQAGRGGRIIQTQSRFSLVRDSRGKPKSILIVSTDLTERKRLEQQFLRAQRMECIGALASGVAHDLNNVFSPILMVAESLADRRPPPADAELVELVRTSAERGAGVVRQLLAFSRGQEIDRVELRVESLLKEMGRLARETFPKNISFSFRAAPDVWPVVGDVVQVHQILLNLCVNARDAMPNGGKLSISASNLRADALFCEMTPDARPGAYVLIEVADTGDGIPAAVLERMFDPFFTTKAPGKGTGLGLPTVLNIVKAHQGFLEVVSRPGHGSRFRVYLPAALGTGEASANAPPPYAPPLPGPPPREPNRGMVRPTPICDCVAQVLERHGYRAVTSVNGADAIRVFARDPSAFDLILTDLIMPGVEGPDFIQAVRNIAPELPIVVMSGLDDRRQEAENVGRARLRFLDKPFTGESLLHTLREALTG